ncbi:MAG: hypothetical protein A2W17_02990 [Planctomycetes bacterium RBG_16_41_13]|nr:MAG: hypothetical protein A2W17_02990 [Planctomycetes bacterium RBG_16_41_13]
MTYLLFSLSWLFVLLLLAGKFFISRNAERSTAIIKTVLKNCITEKRESTMFKTSAKFLIILSLPIILFSQESQAFPDRTVDELHGKTIISSKIKDGFGNRIFVEKSINLAFGCVDFSKTLKKHKPIPGEKTADPYVIKARIADDKKLFMLSSKSCAVGEINIINDALAFLSQAETELEKKNYAAADYAEWKARSLYEAVHEESYTLKLTISGTSEWWFFSRRGFEMTFDNNSNIYSPEVLDTDSHIGYNTSLTTSATIALSKDIIELINKAEKLTCKVPLDTEHNPQYFSIFEINGSNLGNWKEVIRAK